MKNILLITALLLCALTAKADGNIMWGSTKSNDCRVKDYNGNSSIIKTDYCRMFLFLGEASIVNRQVQLKGLTQIAYSNPSYGYFGNYKADSSKATFVTHAAVDNAGGQKYSVIVVRRRSSKDTVPNPLTTGYTAISVAVYTGTSVGKTTSGGVAFADFTLDKAFALADYTDEVTFVEEIVPVEDGGFMWGSTVYGSYRVPNINGRGTLLSSSTARAYLYLGTAQFDDDGNIDMGRLTFLAYSEPASSGLFGNYSTAIMAEKLIQNDKVDFHGGQAYTMIFVTLDLAGKAPPNPLYDRFEGYYVAIQTGTSTMATTVDGAKYARMVGTTAVEAKHYKRDLVNDRGVFFNDHMEFADPLLATINIPKSYVVGYVGADATDDELMDATTNKWPTATSPYALMESYTLNKDPNTTTDIPTVLPGLAASGDKLQLNVSNVTVNPDANADVKYGLISSASPDFSNPTTEVEPQESPALEGDLPTSGVKYYRANLTIQGK